MPQSPDHGPHGGRHIQRRFQSGPVLGDPGPPSRGRSEDLISLAGGLPAPEAFPSRQLAGAIAGLLAHDPGGALQYSATEGFRPLREWVAADNGVDVDQVLVTSGSQQALELVVRTLVDPGAEVALADPGYVGAIQAFHLVGAHLVGVATDDQGLLVDDLARRLAEGCGRRWSTWFRTSTTRPAPAWRLSVAGR